MPEVTQSQAVVRSESTEDQVNSNRTVYDVSGFEIFWRNFLAGMSRTFGGLMLYILLLLVTGNLFLTYVYPSLKPLIAEYRTALGSINNLSNTRMPTDGGLQQLPQIDPKQLQKLIPSP